ncbi:MULTISPECIES: hypothetical protein [Pectobacterium]|uniref:Uncharacterized protein n=2 Tax=Pectobacterium TaxID=122277 RepID=A0AA93DLB1_9GAMM|nr:MULTISPECIES: hypothetical protein [Pectobacterium]GKX39845.1 hypothetical protein SOASR014_35840 [Pectobacterium carotovorum subsp. carotovorum]MBI0557242.1 hypothetical protein [Pectobacterium parmentieri]MBL0909972.1 hypothetical protein [Pectobacterium carotovorum]RRO11467.1 hypothetical protein DMB84_019935 [Pectobacterium aquaticum]GLX45928.1 hypothetical protein Pcaca01_35960 [Pectobacterium carotovorum subsp. carotovorum]
MDRRHLVKEIIEYSECIIRKVNSRPGSCLYISALLAGMINDHLPVTARLVVGSLNISGTSIFKHTPILPLLTTNGEIRTDWDGHAWIAVSGLICDLSLFMTASAIPTPSIIKSVIENTFKNFPLYLIGQENRLLELGVDYLEMEELDKYYINIFIYNAERLGII